MDRRWKSWLTTVSLTMLFGCTQVGSDENLGSDSGAIINGTAPAVGGLEQFGVVSLSSGCSGSLLTNRHVLTAQHCVRDIENAPYVSFLPIGVTLETSAGNRQVIASNAIEHAAPYSSEHLDYAVLVLDDPMPVFGDRDSFYTPIYSSTDASLMGQTVFCAGYGATSLAHWVNGVLQPMGGYHLSSANEIIDDVWAQGTLIRNEHNGIVGAPVDSGSPCFIQQAGRWTVTGPQSNCPLNDWVVADDLDGDLMWDWAEVTGIHQCRGAAPSTFRASTVQAIITDVVIQPFDKVPAFAPGDTLQATVLTSIAATTTNLRSASTLPNVGPRSGSLEVVIQEPPRTMCPHIQTVVPMTGVATISGRCLGDGIVSTVVGMPL